MGICRSEGKGCLPDSAELTELYNIEHENDLPVLPDPSTIQVEKIPFFQYRK